MIQIKKLVLLSNIIILLFLFCVKTETPPKDITDFFPHHVGNSWSYKSVGEPEWTDEVMDSYTWEGNMVYKITRDSIPPHEEWRVFVGGELRVYIEEPYGNSPYTVWLKEPLRVGEEWNFSSTDTLKVKIDALNATVSAPVGEYSDCIKLDTRELDGSDDYIYFTSDFVYFAENVGLIKVTGNRVIELFEVEIYGR